MGERTQAKLLLPDKLSSEKQSVIFPRTAPQFIASKSQYPHLAVETKMKMRGEWYKTLHCGMGLKQQTTKTQKGSIFIC